jgi:hypothetical protein
MGLPVRKKVHGQSDDQGDHHAGLTAQGIAQHQEQPGHGGQQKNGLYVVSHGSPREIKLSSTSFFNPNNKIHRPEIKRAPRRLFAMQKSFLQYIIF